MERNVQAQGQARKLGGIAATILLLSAPGWAGVIMTIVMAAMFSPLFLIGTVFFVVLGVIQAGHYRKHRNARHRVR